MVGFREAQTRLKDEDQAERVRARQNEHGRLNSDALATNENRGHTSGKVIPRMGSSRIWCANPGVLW